MIRTASFSLCGDYRWKLARVWNSEPLACFVGLNPSTADAEHDDATIRRMIGFARDWGSGGIVVVNLFSLRATSPASMKKHQNPVGLATDATVLRAVQESYITVCCWGNNGAHLGRDTDILTKLWRYHKRLECLGLTRDGHPKHPVRLSKNTRRSPFPSVKEKNHVEVPR